MKIPMPSPRLRQPGRQSGVFAIMFAILLIVIIGFFALALDLARIYNRRVEMQTLAESIAIAAVRKLDGTSTGISDALAAGKGVVEDPSYPLRYEYARKMVWKDDVVKFSASRDASADWKDSASAAGNPAGLVYVKVDTGALDLAYGTVEAFFAQVMSSALKDFQIGHVTIAGRRHINVVPFGICAMSSTAHAKRVSPMGTQYDELLEYGFRRGVGYNLLNLNPNGTNPVSYRIDPVALYSPSNPYDNFASWIYNPYVCSGTMAVPRVTGATVKVNSSVSLGTYSAHLNSRFETYTGVCKENGAPPDSNLKQYAYASVPWMSPKSTMQTAKADSSTGNRLQTVADLATNHATAADYGVLWSFARAVPWTSYQTGVPEPAAGYATFAATSTVWKNLYGSGSGVGTYPGATPYLATSGGTYFLAPSNARKPGSKNRRVLNVPLLACPVSGSSAAVLGIGRFLMTIPAEATAIHAEFGGLVSEAQLGGSVEIYQ